MYSIEGSKFDLESLGAKITTPKSIMKKLDFTEAAIVCTFYLTNKDGTLDAKPDSGVATVGLNNYKVIGKEFKKKYLVSTYNSNNITPYGNYIYSLTSISKALNDLFLYLEKSEHDFFVTSIGLLPVEVTGDPFSKWELSIFGNVLSSYSKYKTEETPLGVVFSTTKQMVREHFALGDYLGVQLQQAVRSVDELLKENKFSVFKLKGVNFKPELKINEHLNEDGELVVNEDTSNFLSTYLRFNTQRVGD